MKVYAFSSVSEFLGDRIVYRNLKPIDPRLPTLDEIRRRQGMESDGIPRKQDPEYSRLIALLLQSARQLDAPGVQLKRLAYLGDTRFADANAFVNLCRAGDWDGRAFIGAETSEPERVESLSVDDRRQVMHSNRWTSLEAFSCQCQGQGFPFDEATAVIVDLDKTAIGARGRNAGVIDQVRVQAVINTVSTILGSAFDQESFLEAYNKLNQPEFHPFTADNQDYLAYICLVLGSGLIKLDQLLDDLHFGEMKTFEQFITLVDNRSADLPPAMLSIHQEINANVQAGDPTPFKAFRRNEFLTTIGRMGCLGSDLSVPVDRLLKEEIVITQEVRKQALAWAAQGALLFGLSDKPDEASVPDETLARQGYLAIHRSPTHVVGE